jgi:2-C-methyl-D-erythritol 2,4-cyclodiphosphate synthase
MLRIGHGYDVHKFGGNGPIVLGGVTIDYEQGLVAHSDGDVVIHAVCDAILGALALGDIGRHFPDNDDDFKDIDSRILLRDVMSKARDLGYKLGNLDVTIVAQKPRLGHLMEQMREVFAADLEAQLSQVNVKATTTEGLGFAGRKEGIATHAVVIMQAISPSSLKLQRC